MQIHIQPLNRAQNTLPSHPTIDAEPDDLNFGQKLALLFIMVETGMVQPCIRPLERSREGMLEHKPTSFNQD